MDVPQLKLLAARTRELLNDSSCPVPVGHSHSLDLIAALPGLRNWPEVSAFPERVAACQLDLAATGRLSFRIKKKLDVEYSPQVLLECLRPVVGLSVTRTALEVWPGGPRAGVYLTTSPAAIDALLERYEEATDGAVVYAERAGASHPASIELGESGLWSNGLDRVASGTLIVLGPIEFDQQSWEDATNRIEMACMRAFHERHRVAVLVATPTPDNLIRDAQLMVRAIAPDYEEEIVGVVNGSGDLVPAAGPSYPANLTTQTGAPVAPLNALPAEAVAPLRQAFMTRPKGLVFVGASEIAEHAAIEQVAALLALSEHAGPAARIMPRHRSTPAKDWQVPDAIKALPFLPSIQSAYAQGYRRMVISSQYTKPAVLEAYPDVLFIGAGYGHEFFETAVPLLMAGSADTRRKLLERLIAVLGLLHIPTAKGDLVAPDLLVTPPMPPASVIRTDDFDKFLKEHRLLRWEDAVLGMLRSGACSEADLKSAPARLGALKAFVRSLNLEHSE